MDELEEPQVAVPTRYLGAGERGLGRAREKGCETRAGEAEDGESERGQLALTTGPPGVA